MMRTLEQVKQEEKEIRDSGDPSKTNQKRLLFLKNARLYLEFNPTKEFVELQTKQVERKLDRIEEVFNFRFPQGCLDKKVKAKFDKEFRVKELNNQLEMLKYLKP